MEIKEQFKKILADDEQIIKVIRPKPNKFILGKLFAMIPIVLILALMMIVFGAIGTITDDEGNIIETTSIVLGMGGVLIFILLVGFVIPLLELRNIYYCWTNKRVIIRKGIIGVDFRSLDLENIGALNVDVTIVDKILRLNTGTLSFGSNSMPMINVNANSYGGNGMYGYCFKDIEDPYQIYKEVKAVIDQVKKDKNNQQ